MIIVTGGAGFIGSNIVKAFNKRSFADILIVDDLKNGKKISNLNELNFKDYIDKHDFNAKIIKNWDFGDIEAVFHQGACSNTTEWDGNYMMKNNYQYSKELLEWCSIKKIQFLYASSASVYGMGLNGFCEKRKCERPINMYAFSKFQFDQYVRSFTSDPKNQVVGLRYFNVYGPGEAHKGSMASTAFHFNNQVRESGKLRLFGNYDGYLKGEQKRDFIFVDDCAEVNLWFYENPDISGIYNLGTGTAREFNEMANEIIKWHRTYSSITSSIQYIDFPQHLKGSYQSYTKANIDKLVEVGYRKPFLTLEMGIEKYLRETNLKN